jgi:hypothetical protein
VRRALHQRSDYVHALLRHLEAVGFDGAPRLLGIDAQGREVLTYLPGEVIIPGVAVGRQAGQRGSAPPALP